MWPVLNIGPLQSSGAHLAASRAALGLMYQHRTFSLQFWEELIMRLSTSNLEVTLVTDMVPR